jgi:hypothetical protein
LQVDDERLALEVAVLVAVQFDLGFAGRVFEDQARFRERLGELRDGGRFGEVRDKHGRVASRLLGRLAPLTIVAVAVPAFPLLLVLAFFFRQSDWSL